MWKKLGRNKTKVLIIFNREPSDETDVTWNALRFAEKFLEIRIFLMNDVVNLGKR